MSLTVQTNPISSVSVENPNIFPGFKPLEFTFQRKDITIDGYRRTSPTADYDQYKYIYYIYLDVDPNPLVSVGEEVYLYIRDGSTILSGYYQVLEISNNPIWPSYDSIILGEIKEDPPLIDDFDDGVFGAPDDYYLNYKQNYYVEINTQNLLGYNLKDFGGDNGIYTIDISILNDLNELTFPESDGLISEMVTGLNVQYRETYTGSSDSWTPIGQLYIIYAYVDPVVNDINHFLEKAIIVEGYYRSAITIITSSDIAESSNLAIQIIEYDEDNTTLATTNVSSLSITSGGI